MKIWKRCLCSLLSGIIIATVVCGCSKSNQPKENTADTPFFENTVLFDDYEIKQKMNVVKIKDVSSEAWETNYDTLPEVEKLLGVTLLKSTKTYATPIPCVDISNNGRGEICISRRAYYLYNQIITSIEDDYTYYKKTGDGAYMVSYTATFFSEFDSENQIDDDYTQTVFVKNYTTAHGLEAAIYYWNGQFHALIYHDNIRYEIDMDVWDQRSVYLQRGDETKLLEEYLDTLS